MATTDLPILDLESLGSEAQGLSTLLRALTVSGLKIGREAFGIHVGRGTSNNVPQTPNHDIGQGSLRVWDCGVTHREIAAGGWGRMDQIAARAAALGIKMLYCLGQPPASMTGGSIGDVDGNAAYNSKPYANPADMAAFVTGLLTRYPGAFDGLEVWNEVNIKFYSGTVAELVGLAQATFNAARAVDPSIKIVSPSVTNQGGIAYLDQYLALGGGAYCDVLGVHLYAPTPEDGIDLARAYRAVADKYAAAQGKEMWNTEWTTTSFAEGGIIKRTPDAHLSERDGAVEIVKLMTAPFLGGCTRSYFYGMDYSFSAVQPVDAVTPATQLAPARAFKAIADTLTGCQVVDARAGDDGSCIMEMVDGNLQTIYLAWGAKGRNPVFRPAALGISSISTIDDDGTLVEGEVGEGGFTLRDPIVCRAGAQAARSQAPAEGSSSKSFSVLDNADFALRGFDDRPIGWEITFQGIANYDPAVSGPEFGPNALVLTPASQFRQIRTFLSRELEPGKYAIVPDYKTTDANYKVLIETPGGNGGLPFNPDFFLPPAPRRKRLEVPFTVTIPFRCRIKVALAYQAASGFGPITVAGIDVVKIGEPPKFRDSYQRKVIRTPDGVPPRGNINAGDEIWFTTASRVAAEGCFGRKAKTDGTLGSLAGVTCDISSASRVLNNVNPPDAFEPGAYVSIGGGATKLVMRRVSSTQFEIDATAGATATGAAVAYVAPTWESLGFSPFTDGNALLPDVEISGADGTVRSLSIGSLIANVFRRRFSWRANAEAVTGIGNAGANIELATAKDDGTDQAIVVQINRNSGFAQWLASAFKVAGTWDKAFIVSGVRLWQNATSGALLAKSSSPASDDDGFAVALQNALAAFTSVRIVGADGTAREMQFGNLSGTTFTPRFGIRLNADAVTGSGNAGANVEIVMYNDAGFQIGVPAKWTRASGFFEALASAFKVAGTWDKAFIVNGVRLWQNATTAKLMTKATQPASDGDGVVLNGYRPNVPVSATDGGYPGEWAADANYLYICHALNTWQRVATATW